MDYLSLAKMAINPSGYLLEKAFSKATDSFSSSAANKDVTTTELNEEAVKAKISATVLTEQAKVEQELSIAKRILIAEEVEIEEFYDVSGSGGLGAKVLPESLSFGAHGEGKKVTKRVIKFHGFNSEAINFFFSSGDSTQEEES